MVNIYTGYFKVLNIFTVILPKGGYLYVLCYTATLNGSPEVQQQSTVRLGFKAGFISKVFV